MATGQELNDEGVRPESQAVGDSAEHADGAASGDRPLRSMFERLLGLTESGNGHDGRSNGSGTGDRQTEDVADAAERSPDTAQETHDGHADGHGEGDEEGEGAAGASQDSSERGDTVLAMATLHEAIREMVTAESKQAVVDVGLDAAADVLGFSQSGVHFHDEEANALVPVAWTGSLEDELGEPPSLGPESMAWSTYENDDVVRIDDFWDSDGVHNPDTPFRSEMIVPLGGHGVALFSSTEPDTFDADDQRFAEVLCANAAAALDRIDREADLRRREEELARQNELLEQLTGDVEGSVVELVGSSEDVAASSQQISALAEEEANTMAEVSAEVSDMSAVVEEIASLSDEVGETSESTLGLAEEGHGSATDATDVMEDIEGATAEATAEFDDLHDQIAEIDGIVEVINSVADRTNMLALNASIEAARAGEAGEGFAVVAEEVKSLAEETQQQAGRIEERVAGIQENTDETVEKLRAATEQVQEGIEQVERTRQNFEEIVEAVTETVEGTKEVATATDDQAESSEEIARMVDDAVEKADQVSAEIQEIAAANQQQARKVEEIQESLDRANRQIGDAASTSPER